MSLEQMLVAMAAPLLAGGLHPNGAPQNGARPYGVYTNVVSPTHNTLSDGVPIQQDIVQIDVWADTYEGALTAGNTFAAAVQAADPAPADPLRAVLLESKEKNRGVTLHVKGGNIGMVVTGVDDQYVTGRSQTTSRIVVRIDRIDGVSAMF